MSKITGVDILILVKQAENYIPVGGQRGATLSESRNAVDVTSKTSPGGFEQKEYGTGTWSISCDGVYVESETAYGLLVNAMRNKDKVVVRWKEGATETFEGSALVVSRDLEGPYDGEATYSVELEGDGKPTTMV